MLTSSSIWAQSTPKLDSTSKQVKVDSAAVNTKSFKFTGIVVDSFVTIKMSKVRAANQIFAEHSALLYRELQYKEINTNLDARVADLSKNITAYQLLAERQGSVLDTQIGMISYQQEKYDTDMKSMRLKLTKTWVGGIVVVLGILAAAIL